jgi:hypothetical protein
MTGPCLDVDLDVDWLEDGLVNLAVGCGKDVPDGLARFGVFSGQDREQGGALVFVGALVDDEECLAAALVDRARPAVPGSKNQPVEPDVSEPSFVDALGLETLADPFSGPAIELARTTIVAAARRDLRPPDLPVNVSHFVTCHFDYPV